MSDSLHVQKKHDVQYADSGWFHRSYGTEQFHNVLDALNVEYTAETDFPEYERDFEVRRESLADAVEVLHKIDKGEEVDDVDVECLCEVLDDASTTLSELVDCFNFLLTKSDQKHDYIYVSFF
jgi:hypothetical protein